MARGEWGYQGLWRGKWCCSYKKTTLLICFINIVIALYVLRSIYASIYVFSRNDLKVVKYTPDQIRNMEESVRIRRDNEPMALVKLVNGLKQEFSRDESVFELPRAVKLRMIDEILRRLQSSDVKGNVSAQRVEIELPGYTLFIVNGKPSDSVKDIHLDDTVQWHLLFIIEAVESWRREKLEEAKQLSIGRQGINSTILQEEARMLVRVLESDWAALSEEIGLWIPTEIIHKEHGDKPKGVEDEDLDEDVLPGRPPPPECHAELHTDYDGVAIRWGLTHHRDSAADCCQACIEQAKRAKPGQMKCNIWVYCPAETGCHSPDKYEHKYQECWLKYAEKPKLNFKDRYSEKYRNAHPAAPLVVPWVSGVVSL
ncbi:apple domain-containing protein [Citrus sinensis]|nr:apple domain-containing protein [Citrus sinensis]